MNVRLYGRVAHRVAVSQKDSPLTLDPFYLHKINPVHSFLIRVNIYIYIINDSLCLKLTQPLTRMLLTKVNDKIGNKFYLSKIISNFLIARNKFSLICIH